MNYEILYSELEDQLSEYAMTAGSALQKKNQCMLLVNSALAELRADVLNNGFSDEAREIFFFKKIKPRFASLLILETELYQLQEANPATILTEAKSYYQEELRWITRFFGRHSFLYNYYHLDASELDQCYFLRGNKVTGILMPDTPDNLDNEFATATSELFAQFRAFELLRSHLLSLLNEQNCANNGFIRPGRQAEPLRWTGSVIHAVELGYAIWLSDQVNQGEAELADIMYWLSSTLQVDLSRYTRLFVEIKGRKRLSGTKFIELLRDAVTRYIDQKDALRPADRIKPITVKKVNHHELQHQ
jgi:hypothetical protein